MELGSLLKQARLEAGLSQRQLCGEEITRNMLSRIENGSARPSMDTLRYLAARLGKPVGFFLGEAAVSPNGACLTRAREAWASGEYTAALEALEGFRPPDPEGDPERGLLLTLCRLELAEQALREKRLPYARSLLDSAAESGKTTPYYTRELERRRLLLLARAAPEERAGVIARLDGGELLLRAQEAMASGEFARCAALLDAAPDPGNRSWNLLRGDAAFALGEFPQAAEYYRREEAVCLSRLEQCFLRMEDYKMAYHYACRQRDSGK